jgi:predicted DNA-binding ribbon-helix-helix protein
MPVRFPEARFVLNTLFGEMSPCATMHGRRSTGSNGMEHHMLNDEAEIMDDAQSAPVKEFAVVKRSVVIGGHKTSVSLEDAFWASLKDIAARRGITLSRQIASIDQHRKTSNLSSAIRLFVLDHFRTRAMSAVFIGERQKPPSIVPALAERA